MRLLERGSPRRGVGVAAGIGISGHVEREGAFEARAGDAHGQGAFFSRALWELDRVGKTLFERLAPLRSGPWIELAIDDTVCSKRGRHIFGASMHVDAVTSTVRRKNLIRGHCWVVLVLVVNVPRSKRAWALPLLSRLYCGKKEAGTAYRTKTVLAREMLEIVLTWVSPETRIRLLIDSGYMGKTMLRGLPLDRVTVFGPLKTNVALFRATSARSGHSRGRRRKKGSGCPPLRRCLTIGAAPGNTSRCRSRQSAIRRKCCALRRNGTAFSANESLRCFWYERMPKSFV